jgi:ADP-ribose pyrophosphatase YjhB (NUDIX family)
MFIEGILYAQILRSMPIPCVDLVVMDQRERILLLRRKNEPALNQWWFPGGRVLFNELRYDAAKRKLKEECGIVHSGALNELKTFDWFFSSGEGQRVHSITSLYKVVVDHNITVVLDEQSQEARWDNLQNWVQSGLDPRVLEGLAALETQGY